ncbi:hypothetical protein [Photobacterium proteolyticum]|nr:hypothetical protein [Photobacterium proteolyticum]
MSLARLLSLVLKRKRAEDKHAKLKSRLNYAMSQNNYSEKQHQHRNND